MSFPTNGVYMIKNVGRDLMLGLKDNNTAEGTPIQGFVRNGTVAQQWVIKRQEQPGSFSSMSVSIQSNNKGFNGNGYFAAVSDDSDEPIIYTKHASIIDLVGHVDDTFTMSFTLGNKNLVLSIPSGRYNEVKLENFVQGSARQQWEFIRVSNLQK
ncbi:hypothetical protein EDD22DRAFT_349868 [Suillus occidentalis]|nr:hypothetical protein EDD22DRAFT_349868 [Suillus occidentalis]